MRGHGERAGERGSLPHRPRHLLQLRPAGVQGVHLLAGGAELGGHALHLVVAGGVEGGVGEAGFRRAWARVKITYRQSSVSTKLTGEHIPAPGSTHTWNAPTTGGSPGYMYQWYRNGTAVGNGSSYTANVGSSAFDLRVEVTDQTWSTVAAVLMVHVGGVEASVTGPALVYASEGGGTWGATGRGGSGAYTFDWYLDGTYLGSGPSWNGYPGENARTLRVDMTDSGGEFDSHSFLVRGVGSGDGTCNPVPPALTC